MLRISVLALFVCLGVSAAVVDQTGVAGVSVGQASSHPAPTPDSGRCKQCIRPDENRLNKPPDVTALDLEKAELELPCPGETSDYRGVSVKTKAVDPENDVLTYNYTVSGGRIVGTGANVQWHFTNAQPGTYVIIAGVDDGCGVCGKTEEKTITLTACPSD